MAAKSLSFNDPAFARSSRSGIGISGSCHGASSVGFAVSATTFASSGAGGCPPAFARAGADVLHILAGRPRLRSATFRKDLRIDARAGVDAADWKILAQRMA